MNCKELNYLIGKCCQTFWTVAILYSRMDLACNIALEATSMVTVEQDGRREIDIKRYAKVEKVIMVTKALNETKGRQHC